MSNCNSNVRRRGRLAAACLLLGLCLAPGSLAAEDPLWTAYASGPPARVKELSECSKHLKQLCATAIQKGPAADWATDPDVGYLLDHRTPAMLTIGRELDKTQQDPYLVALVWTAARLGHRELTRKLPAALARAHSDAARLGIIQVLAKVDTPQSVQALEEFLARARDKTPEALICAVCEGLGHASDIGRLPQLKAAEKLVHSPMGLLRMSTARLECGDPAAQAHLLAVLSDKKAPPEQRTFVLKFLVDHPIEGISPTLADLAVDEQDPTQAQFVLRALVAATGFDQPCNPRPGKVMTKEQLEAQSTKKGAPDALRLEDFAEMTQEDRKKVTNDILEWWREHPPAVREAAARPAEPLPN